LLSLASSQNVHVNAIIIIIIIFFSPCIPHVRLLRYPLETIVCHGATISPSSPQPRLMNRFIRSTAYGTAHYISSKIGFRFVIANDCPFDDTGIIHLGKGLSLLSLMHFKLHGVEFKVKLLLTLAKFSNCLCKCYMRLNTKFHYCFHLKVLKMFM
jgi:hypothetical protein